VPRCDSEKIITWDGFLAAIGLRHGADPNESAGLHIRQRGLDNPVSRPMGRPHGAAPLDTTCGRRASAMGEAICSALHHFWVHLTFRQPLVYAGETLGSLSRSVPSHALSNVNRLPYAASVNAAIASRSPRPGKAIFSISVSPKPSRPASQRWRTACTLKPKSLFEKYQAASRWSIKRVIATYTNVSLVVGNSS
jgi:hypothetical protein